MKFKFTPLEIPEVLLVDHEASGDPRGFFAETFRENVFREAGIPPLVQENHSRSAEGILRGLHYQLEPHAQGKLVRCARGRIFDVAVDIRRGSPTCGKWVSAELSDENKKLLWIPAGFLHGFCSLTDCDVIYKATDYWVQELDKGVRWDDPDIGIRWPADKPALSARDLKHPALKDAENNFTYKVAGKG